MTNQTWLTEEAAARLRAELEELEGPRFADIVKKIEAARAEGDLKENGGYHAAAKSKARSLVESANSSTCSRTPISVLPLRVSPEWLA